MLPDPFTVPGPRDEADAEAVGTAIQDAADAALARPLPDLASTVSDWVDRIEPRAKPWVDGTGLDPIPLVDTVTAFAMSAGDLHRISDDPDDYDARTDALTILAVLRAGIRRAQELDALLVKHIYDHGQRGESHVAGVGRTFVHRRDSKVRWDERGTARAIIDHHMDELGGEQPDPYTVMDWLLEAASVGYYRVTALKPLGLDPEDYRHREKGTIAVDIPVPE